jgi:hypothetical protein
MGMHSLDKLFAGVVRAVLVEGVVEIQEEGFDVFDLFWSLVDISVSNIVRGNLARQNLHVSDCSPSGQPVRGN